MTSLWQQQARLPGAERYATEPVTGSFDVAVVGAGLTGLTTALLLARRGRRVVVLEARSVGAVTTGGSTAKISLLQGTRLSSIAAKQGQELLRQYVAGNRVGQSWLLTECERLGVAVQRRAAVTYAATRDEIPTVRAELETAAGVGLATQWREDLTAPFPVTAAAWLPDQAQVDPMSLLAALAAEAEAAGVVIRTAARVRDVHADDDGVVTVRGTVRTERVVLATGIPISDRGGFFARLEPQRSYALALRVPQPTGLDMYLSAGSPARSIRTAPWEDGEVVLVGGSSHVVGRAPSPRAHADDLLTWARRWFPNGAVVARWSAQDYHPVDELPYVGPLLPGSSRVLVATGFAKWGMTNAVAAGQVLTGILDDDLPPWAQAFRSWSRHETSGLGRAAVLNAGVAATLAKDYGRLLVSPPASPAGGPAPGAEPPADESGGARPDTPAARSSPPAEGQGCVVREGLRPVGRSTVDGATREVSAVCPHLGGVVRWNDEERSWDCPLHGSRFDADGELLEGPATRGLTRR